MKLRNFFLAMFGIVFLAFVVNVINEFLLIYGTSPAILLSAPTMEPSERVWREREEIPDWLVPLDLIESKCDNGWVIKRTIPDLKQSIGSLVAVGSSDCYNLVGDYALHSHLWHQGIGRTTDLIPVSTNQQLSSANVSVFFDFDADFESIGLASLETFNLDGFVVHDLNGDAVFNSGEPVIPDANICLNRAELDPICVTSGLNGEYHFEKIIPGEWYFKIYSPTSERLSEFRFTNQLINSDLEIQETIVNGYSISRRYLNMTDFNPIEFEILILVHNDLEHNFFLMQEWATNYSHNDVHSFKIEAYYDIDIRPGSTQIFNGESGPTYDQHDGLDASCPIGTEIVSIAEGKVIAIFDKSTVAILHSNNLVSIYGHGIPLVEENQYVPRGYPVSLCNNKLTTGGPHLHLAIWKNTPWLPMVIYGIPAYADLVNIEEQWVVNHHPLAKEHFVYKLQGGRGIWTEINKPHPPYVRFPGG